MQLVHGRPRPPRPASRDHRPVSPLGAPVRDGPPAAGPCTVVLRKCADVLPGCLRSAYPHQVPMPALRPARSTVMRRADASVTPEPALATSKSRPDRDSAGKPVAGDSGEPTDAKPDAVTAAANTSPGLTVRPLTAAERACARPCRGGGRSGGEPPCWPGDFDDEAFDTSDRSSGRRRAVWSRSAIGCGKPRRTAARRRRSGRRPRRTRRRWTRPLQAGPGGR